MSGWAALAGGASGVMSGWDDNREAIKAQAAQDFKLELEKERAKLVENSAERQAGVMLDPESNQGMLAQRNAEAESESERLGRANDLAIAQAKSGKSANSDALKQVNKQLDHHRSIASSTNLDITAEQRRSSAREVKRLSAIGDHLAGLPERSYSAPTANDIHALNKGDISRAEFADMFGDDGLGNADKAIAEENKINAQKAAAEASDKAIIKDEAEARRRDEREAGKGFDEKYPSRKGLNSNKALLQGAIKEGQDKASAEGKMNSARARYISDASKAQKSIEAAIEAGKPVRKAHMDILWKAGKQDWITAKLKASLEATFKTARGH